MARRGDLAREKVKQTIISAFGGDFVAEQDKKLYVWADENGEKIQFSIALTMPKTIIGEAPKNTNDWTESTTGYHEMANVPECGSTVSTPTTAISEEDNAKIAELMKALELI